MLDNAAADNAKRYAPPSQRNRVLNRRKSGSGDRIERANYSYGSEVEKNQVSYSKNFPVIDHGEAGISNARNQYAKSTLIALNGCCSSDAARLLNERWIAANNSCNDPSVDLFDRPVMYSGASGSSWGHLKLPHQMDFLAELRRSIHNANASVVPTGVDRSGF